MTQQAADDFYPGYAGAFTEIGKEREWRPVTRTGLDALRVLLTIRFWICHALIISLLCQNTL